MGLFGPPNIEKMTAKRDVEGLIKALGHQKDVSVRKAAVIALGEIQDARVVEPLIAALKDSDKDVRGQAAIWLGGIKDARAVEPLITALKDSDKDVRGHVVVALGEIEDARAVEPLIATLNDSDRKVRKLAAIWLGKIKDTRAVEPLIAALKDSDKDVRRQAAIALGEIKDTRAVEPLVAALMDVSVCEAAADALDKIGWQPGQDENSAAYWVFRQEWNKCIEIGAPAVEPLIAILKDSDKEVRGAAASALGQIGDVRAVEPLAKALSEEKRELDDSQLWLRGGRSFPAIANALAKISREQAVSLLIKMLWGDERTLTSRDAAGKALTQIGGAVLVKQLITILENRDKDHDYTLNRRDVYEVTARTLDDITGNNFDGDVDRWQKWLIINGDLEDAEKYWRPKPKR